MKFLKEFESYKNDKLNFEFRDDDDEIFYFYKIFLINLRLAEIDEYLECNLKSKFDIEDCLNELEDIIKIFSNQFSKFIVEILIEKSKYLKYKIEKRLNSGNLSDINFVYFNEFYNLSQDHYKGQNPYLYPINEIDSLLLKLEQNNINSQKLHFLNKLIKKSNKSYEEKIELLNKIVNHLNKKDIKSDFEKISKESILNLVNNTIKKIEFDNEINSNFENIIKDFNLNKLDSNQLLKQNTHSYPDYRHFENKIDFLDKLTNYIVNHELNEYFNKKNILEKVFNIYNLTIESFEEKGKYNNHYEYNPVYLDEQECKTEIKLKKIVINDFIEENSNENQPKNEVSKIEKVNIFLDSSYILPINYQKVKDLIIRKKLTLESKFDILYNRLELENKQIKIDIQQKKILEDQLNFDNKYTELNKQFEDFKTKQTEFESKIKESEFKAIQVLAMFITITTFVLINVKIFENTNGYQSISILLGMAGVFIMFNLFFHLIVMSQVYDNKIEFTKGSRRKTLLSILRSPRTQLTCLCILLIGLSIYFMEKYKDEPILKKIDKKLEIQQKQTNKTYDSILRFHKNNLIDENQGLHDKIDSLEKKINNMK